MAAAALLTLVISAEPAGSAQTNAADQAILALERQWMDAVVKKDRRTLDALLADDFLLLGESWAGDRELKSCAFDRMRVQIRGDVAVVHSLFTFEATVKGQLWKSTVRITDTWIRQGGQWRVLARHASSLPAPQ